jgi:transcription elongation factor Elf1
MRVDPKDGRCRSCDGTLNIVDADDCTLFVECEECGDSYEVETDAFNDGCMTYYPAVMARKMEKGV